MRTVHSLAPDTPIDLFDLRRRYAFLAPLLDAEYGSATFVAVNASRGARAAPFHHRPPHPRGRSRRPASHDQALFRGLPPPARSPCPPPTPSAATEIVDFARKYDPQPFHTDEAAGERSIYGGLIASGWHTCAIAMKLICDLYITDSATAWARRASTTCAG